MNGYCKLNISGKEVGLKFGYQSYKLIMTDKNKSLMFNEDGSYTDIGLSKIIYSGYLNNCINKNVEAEISFDDFSREIDTMIVTPEGVEVMTVVIKEWSESNDIQALIKETEKKNQIVTTQTEILPELSPSVTESLVSDPGS